MRKENIHVLLTEDNPRDGKIAGRIGDSRFTMVRPTPESSEAALRAHLKQELEAVNSQPHRRYPLSFSIGIVPCGANRQFSVEDLLAKADVLLYQDKKRKALAPCLSSPGL